MSYGLDGWGSILGRGKVFLVPIAFKWFWGSPNLLSNGYWGLFPRVKRVVMA
jgi:hypothetical protein